MSSAAEERVVVVGLAGVYPGSPGPDELFDTVLHQRTAFRAIPPERLPLEEYGPGPGRPTADTTYVRSAGLIEGWSFDPERFRIPRATFETVDTAHWLALDVADRLLRSIEAPGAEGLPRDSTGVILGNSMGGEVSRAHGLRLRWPYVLRSLRTAAVSAGLPLSEDFLEEAERQFKTGLTEPGDETLAGGLANTIAGRICNYFDLHGTGYIVDGACSSSLLAVIQARNALVARQLDVAIAGGVDVSLDPFELVGFARLGALSDGDMRIYDRSPSGFLPGEGCGMVALMREETARAQGLPALAVLAGGGTSTDGAGGLTRPVASGHLTAARRAYADARIDPRDLGLIEGHGTGTAVGDPLELEVFGRLREGAGEPAVIGSIKANIGHTKAAAGVAGLLKAVLAVDRAVLPPSTGVREAHPLVGADTGIRTLTEAEPWESGHRVAGVSALGFGGINAHVVVHSVGEARARRRRRCAPAPPDTARTGDVDIMLVRGDSAASLLRAVREQAAVIQRLSDAECHDTAVASVGGAVAPWRAAVPFRSRAELTAGLGEVVDLVAGLEETGAVLAAGTRAFVGTGRAARVGLIFPGQAAPVVGDGTGFAARVRSSPLAVSAAAALATVRPGDSDTSNAQPSIVAASLLGVAWLDDLGVEAVIGLGHSLGELTGLAWAGMAEPATLVDLARERGRLMATHGRSGTSMTSLGEDEATVTALITELGAAGSTLQVAAVNSEDQTVVAGAREELAQLAELCRRRAVPARPLDVSHGFHSRAMEPVIGPFSESVAKVAWLPAEAMLVSTVSGEVVEPDQVERLLVRQLTEPVRFAKAATRAAGDVDLFVECGPGSLLGPTVQRVTGVPTVSLEVGGRHDQAARSVAGLLAGGQVRSVEAWVRTRPFRVPPTGRPSLITNPTGQSAQSPPPDSSDVPTVTDPAPAADTAAGRDAAADHPDVGPSDGIDGDETAGGFLGAVGAEEARAIDPLSTLQELIAETTGLSPELLRAEATFARDLNLNSLQVGQLVRGAATALSRALPARPLSFADATLGEAAAALGDLPAEGQVSELVPLAEPWVASFVDVWRPLDAAAPGRPATDDTVVVLTSAGTDEVADALRELGATPPAGRLVVVHDGSGAAVARSLYRESGIDGVVSVETPDPRASSLPPLPVGETGFHDLRTDGGRWWRREAERHSGAAVPTVLGAGDVCLVTGGVRGITAECVDALAAGQDMHVVVAGRTPAEDPDLQEHLAHWSKRLPSLHYVRADLTDAHDVARLVKEADRLGPVRGLIHGAGINRPRRIAEVTRRGMQETDAAKAGAFERLVAELPEPPRLVVTFGSIIGRAGLAGQAEYAVANDRLRAVTERYAAANPDVRVRHLQWSLWSGVGMGEGLGVVDTLSRTGLVPIGPEEGRQAFRTAVGTEGPVSQLVTSRFPATETVHLAEPDLPLLRFVERVRTRTSGVELVAEAELATVTDRALEDHRIGGIPVLPAVLQLEAAAQAGSAVAPDGAWYRFEDIRLDGPITALTDDRVTVRTSVVAQPLVGAPDGAPALTVTVRGSNDDFAGGGLTAVLREAAAPGAQSHEGPEPSRGPDFPDTAPAGVPPAGDLYGPLFFHSGSFRRVERLQVVTASRLEATITPAADPWFSPFLPQQVLLGDPGVLDASIHALQACHPSRLLLPVRAGSFTVHQSRPTGALRVSAVELSPEGAELRFDIEVTDGAGAPVLSWRSLTLQDAGEQAGADADPRLLGPCLARWVRALTSCHDLDAVVTGAAVGADTAAALLGATGTRPPSGRLVSPDGGLATTRAGEIRITVHSVSHRVGVDAVSVTPGGGEASRPADIPVDIVDVAVRDRLADDVGAARAAQVVWAAREALTKTGVSAGVSLELDQRPQPGRPVTLRHGSGPLAGSVLVVAPGYGIGSTGPVVAAHVLPRAGAVEAGS